ncbi:hypothetical protein [Sagittula sp. S175]|uniref:hypothetical protein n=1 Tax=Sagittula sp. S175 TaxID=3415129 RepID=UPI003C7D20BE
MWYLVDDRNILRAVSERWDNAARACGAPGLISRAVLNLSVMDFIAGLDTQSFMNSSFYTARVEGRLLSWPYRCDSPTEWRCFVMDIAPVGNGALRVTHSQMVRKPHLPVPEAAPDAVVCSQCLDVEQGGGWHPHRIPRGGYARGQRYSVCPACRQRALRVLHGESPPASVA